MAMDREVYRRVLVCAGVLPLGLVTAEGISETSGAGSVIPGNIEESVIQA